jgi:wobble nucleotide-excising tRNase
MIKKIVHIKNLGKFKNFVSGTNIWNGVLEQTTAIYADNGSGKTTFTQIFKSIKGDNSILNKRKTFGAEKEVDILMLDDKNLQYKFNAKKWNRKLDSVEVFDTFFIEANVYLITIGNHENKGAAFEVVLGSEGIAVSEKISKLINERKRNSQKRRNAKNLIKKTPDTKRVLELEARIKTSLKRSSEIDAEIVKLDNKLTTLTEDFGKTYLEKINHYLRLFNPNLQLTKLNKKGSRFVYYLKVKDFDVRSDSESISLKHTLSEGDKSSLALSFFLAKLSLYEDLDKKIIIFDDPISSFDQSRRNVTINQLYNLKQKVLKFILLSHDISFVKDFTDKCGNCLNLKINFDGNSSIINLHDIHVETMTGIFKDLTVMHNFLDNGINSDFDKREIMRCIRPSLEGIFRIKFFNHFKAFDWLGDMIKDIRESKNGEPTYHLKKHLDDLNDLNDYSKAYHHSNPNHLEVPINTEELRNYVIRTLQLIKSI